MTTSIYSHTYANGLVLLVEPMPSVESAAFSLRLPAGCAYEPDTRGGLSTITAELALRGSGDRDNRQFVTDLDNLGVERGQGVSDSHISYSGATLAKNLLPALAIYADLVRTAHLSDDELEPTRLAALQELNAIEDEPSQKVMLELRRRYYPEPWGRPSQGNEAGITSSTLADVRRFYGETFRPNGTILGLAGRVDWPRIRDEVGALFEGWSAVEVPEPAERPATRGQQHIAHESNQTQIGIAYPSVPYRDPDYFQAWGAVGVLSGGMSSRLFTEVRERRGLCYSVYATQSSLRDHGSVMCYAGTSAERAQETLDVTLGELRRLAAGIKAEELQRLKARIKSSLIMQGESSSARAGSISKDWYFLGYPRTLDEVGALVDGLTCESINAYLSQHPPRDFTVVTVGPIPLEMKHAVS